MKQKNIEKQVYKPLSSAETGAFFSYICVVPYILTYFLIYVAIASGMDTKGQAYIYFSNVANELLYLVGAVAFCFYLKKKPSFVGVAKFGWQYALVAALLGISVLCSFSWLNEAFLKFLGLFGYTSPEITVPDLSGAGLIGAIVAMALLPAVCEETVFRGVLFSGMKRAKPVFAVLVSGALFALFHKNPAQTPYQFICGCLFALLTLRSGSVFPAMIAHFVQNAAVLVFTACGVESIANGWVIAGAMLVLIALTVLLILNRCEWKKSERKEEAAEWQNGKFWLSAALGIAFCAFVWIYTFVSYLG